MYSNHSMTKDSQQLEWVNALKAFAILGILLNHIVEEFGAFPWFSNPSYNWPDLSTRLSQLNPAFESPLANIVCFLGWLGDMGPGVFILLSGFTLALSSYNKSENQRKLVPFYRRRLLRILPLYIGIHVLVWFIGVAMDVPGVLLKDAKIPFSLLGLRFTESLFFFLNPSWWFVWLILQLYLIFPFLFNYLTKNKLKYFVLLTLSITLLSRLLGLLNLTYANSLYFWMTGLFFGTRLFEFALGMILAKLFIERKVDIDKFKLTQILLTGIFIYICGFICSLFYFTTLLSNILITIGLSGIFLGFWRIVQTRLKFLKNILLWMGVVSYPVFLLHQPFMQWFGKYFDSQTKILFLVGIATIVFPIARMIELSVNWIIRLIKLSSEEFISKISIIVIILLIFTNLGFSLNHGAIFNFLSIAISLFAFYILLIDILSRETKLYNYHNLHYMVIVVAGLCSFFILPFEWMNIYWAFIIFFIFINKIFGFILKISTVRVILSLLTVTTLFVFTELYLRKNKPIEIGRWGEYPALQVDSITVYSLKPNKEIHLKYNNYDYYVNVNSLGFNSPEINPILKATNEYRIFIIGDAFTMPEGMEYQLAYPYLLEQDLSHKISGKSISVINGGVTGYGPNEMLQQLKRYIDTLHPDMVINQLFINEFDEINIDSDTRRQHIGFSELSMSRKYFGFGQLPNHTALSIQKNLKTKAYRDYCRNKSLSEYYKKESEYFSDRSLNKLKRYLNEIQTICDSKEIELLTLLVPGQLEISKPQYIDYYPFHLDLEDTTIYDMNLPVDMFSSLCQELGISYYDPREMLRNHPEQPVYFKKSWHWNQEGHKIIASHMANKISNQFLK